VLLATFNHQLVRHHVLLVLQDIIALLQDCQDILLVVLENILLRMQFHVLIVLVALINQELPNQVVQLVLMVITQKLDGVRVIQIQPLFLHQSLL